jgi:hypothetical protein
MWYALKTPQHENRSRSDVVILNDDLHAQLTVLVGNDTARERLRLAQQIARALNTARVGVSTDQEGGAS